MERSSRNGGCEKGVFFVKRWGGGGGGGMKAKKNPSKLIDRQCYSAKVF